MRNRTLGGVILALAVLLGAATPALAQGGRPFNFMAGLSFLNSEDETAVGADVYVGQNISEGATINIGWVGNFGIHGFDGFTLKSLAGGVSVSGAASGRLTPIGQFLLLGEFCCEASGFGFKLGGGITYDVNDRFGIAALYHFRRTSFDDVAFTGNEFTFGIKTSFGG